MDNSERVRLINRMYEIMLACQSSIDYAQSEHDKRVYAAMYEAANAVYLLLTEDRLKEKKQRERWQYYLE